MPSTRNNQVVNWPFLHFLRRVMTCEDALDCFSNQQENNQGQYTQLAVLPAEGPTKVEHESDPPPISTMSASSSPVLGRKALPLQEYQLGAYLLVLPSAVLKNIFLNILDLSPQVSIARSLRDPSLFRKELPANQLLHLLAKYEIKVRSDEQEKKDKYLQGVLKQEVYLTLDDKYGNPVQKQVKNPILLLAYAIIQKNPAILAIESSITDDSGRYFRGNAVRYVCRSSNFMMKEIISQLIPGGPEKIKKEMAAIEEDEKNYDLVLMPTLPPGKTIADINYNRLILWPAEKKLPENILEEAILLQIQGEQIQTYRMKGNKIMPDKAVNLNFLARADTNQDESILLSLDPDDKPKTQDKIPSTILNNFSTLKEAREITLKESPKLFEQLRLLCKYPEPLPNKPALIKQVDAYGNEQIILWGNMNGRMEPTSLTDELSFLPRSRFNVEQIPPIQDGVVLVYEGEEKKEENTIIHSNAQANTRDYAAYFVTEGRWAKEPDGQFKTVQRFTATDTSHDQLKIIQAAKSSAKLPDNTGLLRCFSFPYSNKHSITIPSKVISDDVYNALKKGHSICFDLRQFTRASRAFSRKYPRGRNVPKNQYAECDRDWCRLVGLAQHFMVAWVAQTWCTEVPFSPPPNFIDLILHSQTRELKLYYGERFFDSLCGVDWGIIKGDCWPREALPGPVRGCAAAVRERSVADSDLAAMSALCTVIIASFEKSKQLMLSSASESGPQAPSP